MQVDEDRLIHALAPFYGMETKQVNYGPYKNKIIVYACYGICKMPYVTLSGTIQREKHRNYPKPTVPGPDCSIWVKIPSVKSV
jgi:hypothetical protein